MAGDFDSSLPVRTVAVEELQVQTKVGTNLSTDLKKVNGNTVSTGAGTVDAGTLRVTMPTDQAALDVKLQDGTGNPITSTGGALNVNILSPITIYPAVDHPRDSILIYGWDGAANQKVKTDVAGELQIDVLSQPALSHSTDSVKVGDGTDFLSVNADGSLNITDNGGSLTVDGTITVTATNLDIHDLTHVSDSVKVGDGTDFLAVNADGSINVNVTSTTGDKVNVFNQNTSSDIATNATSTHTYTPAANFYLTDVYGSASGKFKIEIKTGVTASEVTRVVLFTQSERQAVWHLTEPLLVVTTDSVVIIRTNLDNQSQPLYSTVQGYLA
jgi:hypothetical protein